MPPARRVAGVLARRAVPARMRAALLQAEARRRVRPRVDYAVQCGPAVVWVTHDDYDVDWETLKSVVADEIYTADYRDTLVLDIGAHKGYFGAYALGHGARHVVSFEPETVNAEYVRRSIATIGASDAWTLEIAAVGSVAGEADLHLMTGSWGHALSPPASWDAYEVGTVRVPVVGFEDALRRAREANGAGRTVVKTNVEGAECDIVLGTPVETWEDVDEVIVATHPWTICSEGQIVDHLGRAGLMPRPSAHPRMLHLRRAGPPRSDRRTGPR